MTRAPRAPRVMMVVRQFYPWVGGAERQAEQLAATLRQAGVEARVVTGWWWRNTARREMVRGVPVFRNFTLWNMLDIHGLRKFAGYIYLLSLFWYLWRERKGYDLIHVHLLSYPAWAAVLAGRLLGKPVIIKVANSGTQSDLLRMRKADLLPGQRQMLPLTLKADRLVALSAESMQELRAAGVPAARIVRIPNGVVIPPATLRARMPGELALVFAGRLVPSKGVAVLLNALAQARQARPALRWRLSILGGGPLRAELKALALQLGLDEIVTFMGAVDDVPAHLAQADVFVLPSQAEGLSNALLEAMARGLACVASDVGGNREAIQPGASGLLAAPNDAAALAAALVQLADDPGLRERLGRQARQQVEAEFGLDDIARRYQELYASLLAGTPAALAWQPTTQTH
jgi:glycosyltransferase involved in cell wall biosynthesis